MKKSLLLMLLSLMMAFSVIFSVVSVLAADPYVKLECENPDEMTDEENEFADAANKKLKKEQNNIGATFNGAWIAFKNVDFKGNGAKKVAVYYSKRPDKCAEDAKIEIRLGKVDGEKVGEVALPKAEGWGTYNLAEANLSKVVKGKQDVYIVMKGSTDSNLWYIANIDYVEFFEAESSGTPGSTNDPGSEPNNGTGDISVAYLVLAAATAAFGGLKLRKK